MCHVRIDARDGLAAPSGPLQDPWADWRMGESADFGGRHNLKRFKEGTILIIFKDGYLAGNQVRIDARDGRAPRGTVWAIAPLPEVRPPPSTSVLHQNYDHQFFLARICGAARGHPFAQCRNPARLLKRGAPFCPRYRRLYQGQSRSGQRAPSMGMPLPANTSPVLHHSNNTLQGYLAHKKQPPPLGPP